MIDLQQFCQNDEDGYRSELLGAPFTAGQYSYASNGHILVRVPARDGVAAADNWQTRAAEIVARHFRSGGPLHAISVEGEFHEPATEDEPCTACNGAADAVDECGYCEGEGIEAFGRPARTWLKIGSAWFNKHYVDLIASLPNIKVDHGASARDEKGAPMYFAFDGGEGLLMPRREPVKEQVAA